MIEKRGLFGEYRLGKFNITRDRIILAILIVSIIFISVLILLINSSTNVSVFNCGDKTSYNSCSLNKPYFCLNKTLVKKASVCGCPARMKRQDDSCISDYQSGEKKIKLKYILRGEEKYINFSVYGGMSDYLSNFSRIIYYDPGKKPLRLDFKSKEINEEEQKELLLPLVIKIQNLVQDKEDQVRIAISLVQNIPFGSSNKTINFIGNELIYSRFPYEVLYDNQGVCGEKSELLAFLLKHLGYGTALFYYSEENHEAVGIRCPKEFSLDNTEYCFIETTAPSIITDDGITYVGGKNLLSTPELMVISDGESLSGNLYEYDDAKKWVEMRSSIKKERNVGIFNSFNFEELIKKYGLVSEYHI